MTTTKATPNDEAILNRLVQAAAAVLEAGSISARTENPQAYAEVQQLLDAGMVPRLELTFGEQFQVRAVIVNDAADAVLQVFEIRADPLPSVSDATGRA